jgi:cell division protein FtsZ
MPRPYVPSGAERPQLQRRVVRPDDLPPVARAQMEQPRTDEPRNARALFRRLASNVGLNLGGEADAQPEPERVQPQFDDAAARSAIEAAPSRPAPRQQQPEGAAGHLDAHGRAPARAPQKEQLEIPAFLKRHG